MREALRRAVTITELDPPGVEEIEDITLPGPATPLPARVWRPFDAADNGAGAGPISMAAGSLPAISRPHAALCQRLAAASGVRVVSVGPYRRAPEHAFPAAVNECAGCFRRGK